MNKFLLMILLCINVLNAAQKKPQNIAQLVVVIANDMNATDATMNYYEWQHNQFKLVAQPQRVNLAKHGLGFAASDTPQKMEGDLKAPIGLFALEVAYTRLAIHNSNFPTFRITPLLICVDDSENDFYNRIIHMPTTVPKSYETLFRRDHLYDLLLTISYNPNAVKKRGSCIFLHIQREKNSPTVGCTSMPKTALIALYHWLDHQKNPHLLQITANQCNQWQQRFKGIVCP